MTDPQWSAARAWVDIDLSALRANARALSALVQRPLLPMIKANAYGLGIGPVARTLDRLAPWGFGVATVEEGVELRSFGIARPIVVFTPILPWDIAAMREHALRPVLNDIVMLRSWIEAGDDPFHVEIDTGMSRGGLRWNDRETLAAISPWLARAPGWEGVFTHFHSAECDVQSVQRQQESFEAALAALPKRPALVHAANSASAASDLAGTDLVRPGIFLYGAGMIGGAPSVRPTPVAALRTRVVSLRTVEAGDTVSYGGTWTATRTQRIATLAAGYADGVLRSLSNRGLVELEGRLVPIVGRVTMDLTMVALPDDLGVGGGDIATIWGGAVSIDAQALAAGTISYELMTALGRRVTRRYLNGD